VALSVTACQGFSKLDWTLGRAGWQRPADVVRALDLEPGDRVADLGAGDGYFVPFLEDAVGAQGRVYAVEVEPEKTRSLEERFAGVQNVEVVLGRYEDPELPDGFIDAVLIVNTFHHIEDRPDYFARLRSDLGPGGRVAVLEPDGELTGLLSLFLDEGHTGTAAAVGEDMRAAGYRHVKSLDFLAIQIFEIFEPDPDAD
jgi:ubiquinone/menaquinone biosynthesis C-methylase UbiE